VPDPFADIEVTSTSEALASDPLSVQDAHMQGTISAPAQAPPPPVQPGETQIVRLFFLPFNSSRIC
jgi:hypothetical protein